MAGGRGSRLLPITETMPKPLVPVGNVPAIRRILRLISRHGIKEAVITTGYLAAMLEEEIGDICEGVTVQYSRENEPKGTAGSVLSASDMFCDEEFVVISGDSVCETNLTEAIRKKHELDAEALIILSRVENPSEYGVVLSDSTGKITGFSEKPSLSGTYSNTVNTGIYVLSRSILDLIPRNRSYDFGRELFPELLNSGRALYSHIDSGYWCDIGDPESYHGANMRFSGDHNVVAEGCEILSRDIKHSVIMKNCSVAKNCRITEAILCPDVKVEEDCVIGAGCIVGHGSVIGEGSVLTEGTRLSAGSHVPSGMILRSVAICGGISSAEALMSDSGLSLRIEQLSASLSVKIGASLANATNRGKIGIMQDGSTFSGRAGVALARGIRSFGGEAIQLGHGFDAAASSAASLLGLDLSIMLSCRERRLEVSFFDSTGLYPKRDFERRFLSALSGDLPISDSQKQVKDIKFLEDSYIPFIKHNARPLEGVSFNIIRENRASQLLGRILTSLGAAPRRNGIKMSVSDDGFKLSAEQDGFILDDWHIKAILLHYLIRDEAALPSSAPAILSDISSARVLRYSHCPSGDGEDEARELSKRHPMLNHACIAAIKLISLISSSEKSLFDLSQSIPPFSTDSTELLFPRGSGHLGILSELGVPDGDGVKAEYARGNVRIIPKRGGFSLSAEAASGEYASELLSLSSREIKRLLGRL